MPMRLVSERLDKVEKKEEAHDRRLKAIEGTLEQHGTTLGEIRDLLVIRRFVFWVVSILFGAAGTIAIVVSATISALRWYHHGL